MQIINHTIKKPKWVEPERKTIFKTTSDEQKYWEEEKRRWREGYGDGEAHISGMHYYYLREGRLKDGSDGTLIRPKYRDCDEWIINPLHDAFWKLDTHIGLVKRREIGATSIGAGLLPSYSMRMFPNSTFGMTSCDQSRIFKAFDDKTEVFLNNMDLDIRPSTERRNATKQQVYLKLGWKVKDLLTGEPTINYSDLFAKETSESDEAAKGFSGTRMRGAYYDEFPIHKRKKKLLTSSKACFMKQTMQSGLLFWAGTVEADLKPEQIAELQQLVEDSELLNFQVIFASAWWGLIMDEETGVSDEKAGIEWVMKEREKLDKLEDKTDLKAFIKNYPLTLDEIFELGQGARFEDDVADKINEQVKVVLKSKELPRNCTFTELGGEIIINPSVKDTPIKILEQAKPDVDYYVVIDGTATSKQSGADDGSEIAAVVNKMFDPDQSALVKNYCPVLTYNERPKSLEQSYRKIIEIIKHYNKFGRCKVMAEGNAGTAEHFGASLVKEGLQKVIMPRKDLSGKSKDNKNKWFVYRTVDVMDWQYRQANVFLRKYISGFMFLGLLRNMQLPRDRNADLLDAWLMFLVAIGADFDKPVVKKEIKPKKIVEWSLGADGNFQVKTRMVQPRVVENPQK